MMKKEILLVFAPHPDDEVIGCGGYMAQQKSEGASVYVVIVSDGALNLPKGHSSQIRQSECQAGLAHLEIKSVQFWSYPDGQIPLSGTILEDYRRVVNEIKPTQVLLPHTQESHPDHIRVTRGFLKALEGQWQGQLLFYETVKPVTFINYLFDITVQLSSKRLAMQAHVSQLRSYDYVTHIQTLARLRGLQANVTSAEAFARYEWDGSYQHFFENRPLISVIIHANDMSYLQNALLSLIHQSYDQLEVILVWFGVEEPILEIDTKNPRKPPKVESSPLENKKNPRKFPFTKMGNSPFGKARNPPRFPFTNPQEKDLFFSTPLEKLTLLDIRYIPGKASRSFNLNLGLSEARGEYIAILDQDDIVYPQHFATLLSEIHGQAKTDIVYSGCKVVACEKHDNQISVKQVLKVMNHAWQPGRLFIGNQIPIHALLFRANVFRSHQFDEELEAYEDWELLARLSLSNFTFTHCDEITCEYRIFSEKSDIQLGEIHSEKGYASSQKTVLGKLLPKLEVKHFQQIVHLVGNLEKQKNTLEKQLDEQGKQQKTLQEHVKQLQSLEQFLLQACQTMGIKATGRQCIAQFIGQILPQQTLFSIILPVYNTNARLLEQTLLSIRNQAYPGWELCLVDDASDKEETQQILKKLQADQTIAERLHYQRRESQGGIVATSNDAIAKATAPYLVFLDHDDLLHPEALLHIALILQQHQDYRLIYTDNRLIDHSGRLMQIYHKTAWAPETLLHFNYINHLTVVKRETLQQLGGLRHAFEGTQDWDLLLQLTQILSEQQVCHISQPLYDWRATENSIAYQGGAKPWLSKVAQSTIVAHLKSFGLKEASVIPNQQGPGFVCQWQSSWEPIEVIIPTHTNINGLKTCLAGLLQLTDYLKLTITIVGNRCSSEVNEFLNTLQSQVQIRIVFDDSEFNWARLNNRIAKESKAPFLLFLNDDVEIKNAYWLRDLYRYLDLSGVGAVGATLFYPNGELQHNGIYTDFLKIATNITEWGKMDELRVTRNVSAVTGACLLTKQKVWEQVGGFEERLAVSYNDVDFCLALRAQNLRIVQATDVELIHHEHATYGTIDNIKKQTKWQQEAQLMRDKWSEHLKELYFPHYEVLIQQTRILHVP